MSDRPLSERVLDVSEMWHYTTCVTDTAPDAECDCVISNLADEIAALEAELVEADALLNEAWKVTQHSPDERIQDLNDKLAAWYLTSLEGGEG